MKDDKMVPKDAKIISGIIRSLDVAECEPMVISQLLEYAHRYVSDVLIDARDYAIHCKKEIITTDDIKLAIQTRIANKCVAVPARKLLQAAADEINKKPLTVPDNENLIRAPGVKSGFYGVEYDIEESQINQHSSPANEEVIDQMLEDL